MSKYDFCRESCDYEWTDEAVLNGYRNDETGEYFVCGLALDKEQELPDHTNCGSCYISSWHSLFPVLKKRYRTLKEEARIEKLHRENHTLLKYMEGKGE